MPPVSLLFSSDEQTSRLLMQALQEIELAVEPCPDVFTAVEWLAGRSFDVIVADCDSGPEAAFLLSNAHELKLNVSAFTLAVTSASSTGSQEEIGADLVLTKPLVADQIKYALLTNDHFLGCMKAWIARGEIAPAPAQNHSLANAPPPTQIEPPSPIPQNVRPVAPSPVRMATGRGTPNARSVQTRTKPRRTWLLGGIALVAVAACAVCVYAQPLQVRSVFARVATAYKQVLDRAHRENEQDENLAVAEPSPELEDPVPSAVGSGGNRPMRVRVVPVSPMPASAHAMPPAAAKQPNADPDQDRLAALPAHHQIPASLTAPPPDIPEVRTVSTKRPVSLLGQVEPVILSETLAHDLLLERVQPSYPEQALRAGVQGVVVLQAWIGKDGSIRDLKLVNGSFLLGQAAVNAVRQWRYKPYVQNGVAVDAETYVTVNFKLP